MLSALQLPVDTPTRDRSTSMFGLLITLAIIALILSLLGFTGVAAALRGAAWIILIVALVLFIIAFLV